MSTLCKNIHLRGSQLRWQPLQFVNLESKTILMMGHFDHDLMACLKPHIIEFGLKTIMDIGDKKLTNLKEAFIYIFSVFCWILK